MEIAINNTYTYAVCVVKINRDYYGECGYAMLPESEQQDSI
jgi:hypothetical protein